MNIRQRKAERHKESLRKLSQEGGNKSCFDCGMRGPLYIVSDFCILVCSTCSAVHRSFQHKVKGITMSEFAEDEIARFSVAGNDRARKVWLSTFRGHLPSSGDMIALKDHVRSIFEERRCWNAQEYAALQRAWENPTAAEEQPALVPPPATTTPAAKLAPAPEAPAAVPSRHVAAAASAAPASAADNAAARPAPPPPARPPQDDIFDSLFAAPVVSPPMPAAVQAPPAPAPTAPTANAAPPHPPPAPVPVASLVDDLFAVAPAPAMAPTGSSAVGAAAAGVGGFGSAYPTAPQPTGAYPASGNGFDFTQGAPFAQPGMPAPYQAQQQPGSYLQQQLHQQQPFFTSSGAAAQAYAAPAQNFSSSPYNFTGTSAPTVMSTAPAAAPFQYSQQQQQEQQQPFTWGQPMPAPPATQPPGMYGSNPQVAGPYGSGAPSQPPPPQSSFDFTSGAPNYGGGAPFAPSNASAPQPYIANSMAQGGAAPAPAWGAPSPSQPVDFSSGPNRSRITVLSVSKPASAGAPSAAPQWP